MVNIRRQLMGLGFIAGSSVFAMGAAHAMNGESNINVDGGPLGQLEISGGVAGYGFAQSNSTNYTTGTRAEALYLQLEKNTGILQFTVITGHDAGGVMVGMSNSSVTFNPNGSPDGSKGTSILDKAYLTLAPKDLPVTFSAGILSGVEGYESGTIWNDVSAFTSVMNYVETGNQIGVNANITEGPASLLVQFGDTASTHVFNTLELLGTYNFNSNNVLNAFASVNLGRIGKEATAAGVKATGTTFSGNTSPGGSVLYTANANAVGAYYSWTQGNLNLVPEVQYIYTKVDHKLGIDKLNSNLGVGLFGDYSFANTPYSLGAWGVWDKSIGSGDTAANTGLYAYNPNDETITFAVAPTWQYKYVYARLNGAYINLLNRGSSNVNWNSTKKSQFMAVLDTGLVF